jgi:fructokinase
MKVLAFGEILWDIIKDEEFVGGAPFNFAAHSAQCGNEAYIISRVGDDRLGAKAIDLCRTFQVKSQFVQIDPNHPTGVVDVVLAKGQPDYSIREDVAYDYIEAKGVEDLDDQAFDVLYFGSLAQRSRSASALDWILENHKFPFVFYDVNIRKSLDHGRILKRSLPRCNIVKMNTEEVSVVSAALNVQDVSDEDVCHKLVETYPNINVIIITAAEKGCFVFYGGHFYYIPGIPVVVEDAIGAGDAFSAAFMNEYFRTGDPVGAASVANRVGGFVASRRGPIPMYTEEIIRLCK